MKPIFFIALFFIVFTGETQSNNTFSNQLSQQDKLNAEKQIKNLQNGALLVRLRTRKPLIDALRKTNRDEEATEIIQKQKEINKNIIGAFKMYFDFCPTYFFYSDDSKKIENGAIDSVSFINEEGLKDESITMNAPFYLIAEFTRIKSDTATYPIGTKITKTENGLEKRTIYGGGTNFGFEALVFKNAAFYQLRKPFPYYSRTLQSLPILRRSYAKVVRNANDELRSYYNRVN